MRYLARGEREGRTRQVLGGMKHMRIEKWRIVEEEQIRNEGLWKAEGGYTTTTEDISATIQ